MYKHVSIKPLNAHVNIFFFINGGNVIDFHLRPNMTWIMQLSYEDGCSASLPYQVASIQVSAAKLQGTKGRQSSTGKEIEAQVT